MELIHCANQVWLILAEMQSCNARQYRYASVQEKYLIIALPKVCTAADTLKQCIAVLLCTGWPAAVQIKMKFEEVQCQMALGRLPARTIMMMGK